MSLSEAETLIINHATTADALVPYCRATAAQLSALRTWLIQTTWPDAGVLPTSGADVYTSDVASPITSITNLARVDKLEFLPTNDPGAETLHAWLFVPTTATYNNFVAVGQHRLISQSPSGLNAYNCNVLIRELVADGMTVLGYLTPQNEDYAALMARSNATFHGWAYFVEAVIRGMNEVGVTGYTLVGATGLSGGAWQTMLLGAMRTDVEVVLPVATLPPFYVLGAENHDAAGAHMWTLGLDPLRLYAMGSIQPGRTYRHMMISADPSVGYNQADIEASSLGAWTGAHFEDYIAALGGDYTLTFPVGTQHAFDANNRAAIRTALGVSV